MARVPLLVLVAFVAGCLGDAPADDDDGREDDREEANGELRLERMWGDLDQPLLVTHDGARTFVVEQCGRILAANGSAGLEPWLEVDGISCGGEQGLLGLAFPPDHDQTGRFYIAYTDEEGTSILERRTVGGGSGEVLLSVEQPFANHNGGHLAFGPDGMLYYGLGDGGAAGDPGANGQDPNTLLGSILRLDVSGDGYTSPPDNPFVGEATGRDEVWSYGLRNPWRFSFDGEGAMWIGDVGQDCWEEVNREPAGAGGRNYGWPRFEGNHPYALPAGVACPDAAADVAGFTFPVAEVRNADHCSVTGGHVANSTALAGSYVFGDYCSGTIWTLTADDGGWSMEELMETSLRISSFGMDAAGTLYVVDHQGAVHRFTE